MRSKWKSFFNGHQIRCGIFYILIFFLHLKKRPRDWHERSANQQIYNTHSLCACNKYVVRVTRVWVNSEHTFEETPSENIIIIQSYIGIRYRVHPLIWFICLLALTFALLNSIGWLLLLRACTVIGYAVSNATITDKMRVTDRKSIRQRTEMEKEKFFFLRHATSSNLFVCRLAIYLKFLGDMFGGQIAQIVWIRTQIAHEFNWKSLRRENHVDNHDTQTNFWR